MNRWITLTVILGVLPVLMLLAPLQAEAAMFLKISGVAGESTDKDHGKWIDVLAVSPAVTRSTATKAGGSVQVNDITVTKYYDASSPLLQSAVVSGQLFDVIEIHITDSGGNVIKIQTFKKVSITGIMPGFDAKSGTRTEQVTFTAEALK